MSTEHDSNPRSKMPDWLTVREASEWLRIGRRQCYALVHSGDIPSVRFGRTIRIPRHALTQMTHATSRAASSADLRSPSVPDDSDPFVIAGERV